MNGDVLLDLIQLASQRGGQLPADFGDGPGGGLGEGHLLGPADVFRQHRQRQRFVERQLHGGQKKIPTDAVTFAFFVIEVGDSRPLQHFHVAVNRPLGRLAFGGQTLGRPAFFALDERENFQQTMNPTIIDGHK